MNNPVELVRMMRTNPQAVMQSILGNNQIMQNPIISNAVHTAQKGDMKGLNQIAENMCKSKGMDFKTEFERFKSQFPIQ